MARTREQERIYRAQYTKRRYLYGKVRVDATGTHRRLQALMAVGWCGAEIAKRAGFKRSWTSDALLNKTVFPAKRDLVKRLYDELWNQQPPLGTPMERHNAAYAQTTARKNGWPPPAAWDDDTIDDPNAEPNLTGDETNVIDFVAVERAIAGMDVALTDAELDAAAAALMRTGVSPTMVTKRLKIGHGRAKRIWQEVQAA